MDFTSGFYKLQLHDFTTFLPEPENQTAKIVKPDDSSCNRRRRKLPADQIAANTGRMCAKWQETVP